jgi:hypothetical protein
MINKEKLMKKLIDAYEDYIIEASVNIPLDEIMLNHPDGAEFGVVQTDLGAKLNNYRDVINTLKFCLLNEESSPLIRHSYDEETKREMKYQTQDLYDLMVEETETHLIKHSNNKS